MSAPGEPPVAGTPPLLPRWFSFAVLPFLLALTITVAIAAFVNHQQVGTGLSPAGLGPARAAVAAA